MIIIDEMRARYTGCGSRSNAGALGLSANWLAGIETLVYQLMPIVLDDDAAMLRQAPKALRLYALKGCFPAVSSRVCGQSTPDDLHGLPLLAPSHILHCTTSVVGSIIAW
jgi:hypothetical protein